jgi:hypothetical protein
MPRRLPSDSFTCSAIKKIIYAISKREADELQQEGPRNERNLQARHSIEIDSDDDQGVTQPLLTPREQGKKSKEHDTDEELLAAMQTELARINQFYIGKEADFNQRLIKVEFEMTTVERQLPVPVKVSSWMWLAGGSPDAVGGSPDAQSVASGEGGQADVMSLIESLDAPDGHTSSSLLNTRHVPGNREVSTHCNRFICHMGQSWASLPSLAIALACPDSTRSFTSAS